MYTKEILTYLGWPFLIIVSYLLSRWAINIYEKKAPYTDKELEK